MGLVPAIVVRAVAVIHAGTARELGHLSPRRRSARKVGVAANRRKSRGTSSEVVVRDGLKDRGAVLGAVASTVAVVAAVSVTLLAVARGVEGAVRSAGNVATESRDAVIWGTSGRPVDRSHAVLEVGRRLELPLADDGPADRDGTNAGRDDDQDGETCLGRP